VWGRIVSNNQNLTDEQLANKLTALAVKHLNKLPPKERGKKIQAFEKRIATSSAP
jgi:hypothetical protein